MYEENENEVNEFIEAIDKKEPVISKEIEEIINWEETRKDGFQKINLNEIEIDTLIEHQYNNKLYDDNDNDINELAESMNISLEHPIIINNENVIVSGHRRVKAAKLLGWKTIKYQIKYFKNKEEELSFLLTENIYRIKSTIEQGKEAKLYKEVESKLAKQRQLFKLNNQQPIVSPNLDERSKGRTDKKVAEKVGLKKSNYVKVDKILDNNSNKSKETVEFVESITNNSIDAGFKLSQLDEDKIKMVKEKVKAEPKIKISSAIKQVEKDIHKEQRKNEIDVETKFKSFENQIILGNCVEKLKELPDEFVDCIIIDPPYLIDYVPTRKTVNVSFNDKYSIENINMLEDTFKELKRIIKSNGHLYSFFAMTSIVWFRPLIEKYFSVEPIPLIWVKNNHTNGHDTDKNYMNMYEPIFYFKGNNTRLLNNAGSMNCSRDVLNYAIPSNKQHDCEKPIELLEYLIKNSTIENEIVLDCFAGSGSTLVAAKKNNRKYIGIEILDENVRIAIERINKK